MYVFSQGNTENRIHSGNCVIMTENRGTALYEPSVISPFRLKSGDSAWNQSILYSTTMCEFVTNRQLKDHRWQKCARWILFMFIPARSRSRMAYRFKRSTSSRFDTSSCFFASYRIIAFDLRPSPPFSSSNLLTMATSHTQLSNPPSRFSFSLLYVCL